MWKYIVTWLILIGSPCKKEKTYDEWGRASNFSTVEYCVTYEPGAVEEKVLYDRDSAFELEIDSYSILAGYSDSVFRIGGYNISDTIVWYTDTFEVEIMVPCKPYVCIIDGYATRRCGTILYDTNWVEVDNFINWWYK